MLYMTFLNAILALLITSKANNGCTALYCACTYRYCTRYLYFDLYFLLDLKSGQSRVQITRVRIVEVELYNNYS